MIPPKKESEQGKSVSPLETPKMTWASILKSPASASPLPNKTPLTPSDRAMTPPALDILDFHLCYDPQPIIPRGLLNTGNMCFMNSILQPLVHCAPFYNFFDDFSQKSVGFVDTKLPLLSTFMSFLKEFKRAESLLTVSDQLEDSPLSAEHVFDALVQLKKCDRKKGRQEDAEEFLGFLLDGLEQELLLVRENEYETREIESQEWVEVGPKLKKTVTHQTKRRDSPISKLFGGSIRSIVKSPGVKDSVTIQPFQSLQLDITPDNVKSIQDALSNLTQPEKVHGFSSQTSLQVCESTTKQIRLESLPPILILHLKRFVYDASSNNTLKLCKFVEYPPLLEISMDKMSRERKKGDGKYRLTGVIYHHGKLTNGGHYTCHVLLGNQQWIEMDDTSLSPVSHTHVLESKKDRQAYMLFYTLK